MYMYRLDSQRALTQGSRGRGEGGCSVWEGADAAWPGTMLQGKGQIFTTDLALAVIMAAPRSVESWDIVVQRQGEAMFLDVREGSSVYDNIVNETAQEAREDDAKDSAGSVNNMNSMTQLNLEASYITYCYAQQCLDKTLPPETVKQEGKGGIGLVDAWNQRPREQEIPAGKVAYPPPPLALLPCRPSVSHSRDASEQEGGSRVRAGLECGVDGGDGRGGGGSGGGYASREASKLALLWRFGRCCRRVS